MRETKTYEVDGVQMTMADIVAACPGVSYDVLWLRLNEAHWKRIEDLRIPAGEAGNRNIKSERFIGSNYAMATKSRGIKRNPKWSLNDIAKRYGLTTSNARHVMNKSGLKATACGSTRRLYYDSVEVESYMRSAGKLPK